MRNTYIPSNLELEKFLTENPPRFKYHIDCFRYILSLITEIPAYNKDILDENKFVPVNKKKLQKHIHNYKLYLDYLAEYRILETDNHYIAGEKSKGLRFTDAYCTPVKVEQIKKYTLLKSLGKKTRYEERMQKKYPYLRKWFNEDLRIDFEGANEYLHEQLNENLYNGVENALLKFNASAVNVHRFNQEGFFFKVDANVHRLHTNLTVMKSELRNFITYGEQQLVSVDFVNSQPCFSGALLDEKFYSMTISAPISTLNDDFFNIYNISKDKTILKELSVNNTNKDISNYIMVVNNGDMSDNEGFRTYRTEIEKGTLYEYIQREVEGRMGIAFEDRKRLKEVVFIALFTDNRFIGQEEARPKRIFRELFPKVYDVFKMIKRHDSTLLPRLLQMIESRLMLDHVAKRIAKEHPHMPIFTIHDSVVCPRGNEMYVEQVMKQEMEKAIGIRPQVKIDYWTPENLAKPKGIAKELKSASHK